MTDTDEILDDLKWLATNEDEDPAVKLICKSAADEIKRLRAEMAKARHDQAKQCWEAVSRLVKTGELDEPAHSERNGIVLASNEIMRLRQRLPSPPEEE